MGQWQVAPDRSRINLGLLGGELLVQRTPTQRLIGFWRGGVPSILTINLTHIDRFAADVALVDGVDNDALQRLMQARWLSLTGSPVAPGLETLDQALPSIGSWVAPLGVRVHLAKVFPAYLEQYAMEAPAPFFVGNDDPI